MIQLFHSDIEKANLIYEDWVLWSSNRAEFAVCISADPIRLPIMWPRRFGALDLRAISRKRRWPHRVTFFTSPQPSSAETGTGGSEAAMIPCSTASAIDS